MTIDILNIRRRLNRHLWGPPSPFGPAGWTLDAKTNGGRIIITLGPTHDGLQEWVHASISHPNHTPYYHELAQLHRAVWPGGWAYQVFAPPEHHVNIHDYALHLWGRTDGSRILPNFGHQGTI